MCEEKRFCDSIAVEQTLCTPEGSWMWNRGVRRAVVIRIQKRAETTPLLTVVDQDLQLHNLDAAHFYKEPEKPPAKEMTVSEISEKLGYEVKVVK